MIPLIRVHAAVAKYKEIILSGKAASEFDETPEAKALDDREQFLFMAIIAHWKVTITPKE